MYKVAGLTACRLIPFKTQDHRDLVLIINIAQYY